MKGIIFLVISSFVSVHYCHAQRAFKGDEMKKYLPEKTTKFDLANQLFELKDTTVITPNAVYVLESEEVEYQQSKIVNTQKSYVYLRFFNDGKAFFSFSYLSYPSVEEFNDLSYGRPAYYTIKDGQVIVEIYMDRAWGVMSMVARPLPNGIEFYKLAGSPNVKIKEKDKGVKEKKKGNNFFYKKDSSNSFYKKEYTRLYNWLQ